MRQMDWNEIAAGASFWERYRTVTLFLGCMAVGVAFRLYGLHAVRILNNDTLFYLEQAEVFKDAGLVQGIRDIVQEWGRTPVYPLMIHALDAVLNDPLRSAMGVSFFFGVLCLIPFFFIAFRLVDRRSALLAVLLLAVNSYYVRYSILVVRETAALFFCLGAAAAALLPGIPRGCRWTLFGLLAACGMVLRPEYIVFYAITSMAYLAVRGRWRWLLLIGGAGASLVLLSGLYDQHPLLGLFHRLIGSRVVLQLSRSLATDSVLVGMLLLIGKSSLALLHFLEDAMALMNPLAGLLALTGMVSFIRRRRDLEPFQLLLVVAVPCAFLVYSGWAALGDTFTKRWMILPASLLFLFVGQGIEAFRMKFPAHRHWIPVVAVALLLGTTVLHTLFYRVGGRREGLKFAGAYIAREWRGPHQPLILTDEPIVALYAQGKVWRYNLEEMPYSLGFLTASVRPDYLVVKEVDGEGPHPDIVPLVEDGILVPAASFPYGSRHGRTRHLGVYKTRFGLRTGS